MPRHYESHALRLWRKTTALARSSLTNDTQSVYETGIRLFHDFSLEMCPALLFPLHDKDWAMFYVWNTERVAHDSAVNYLSHVAFLQETTLFIPRPIWPQLPLLARAKRGRKLRFGKKRRRTKLPVTYRIACQARAFTGLDPRLVTKADLLLATFICIMLVGICGLFRLGELLLARRKGHDPEKVLRHGQVTIFDRPDFGPAGTTQVARIWLLKSKGDVYGDGTPVFVPANSNDPLNCPVEWLKAVKRLTHNPRTGDLTPMFMTTQQQILLKTPFINWLRKTLQSLGYQSKLYAGHSLRIGGAVSAKRNGIPHHVIQMMGRWKSHAYELYIKYTPDRIQRLRDHIATKQNISRDTL